MRKRFAFLAILSVLFVPQLVSADPVVIFNTFGQGGTFGPGAAPILGPGFPLSEGDVTPGQQFAASFVAPAGTFAYRGVDLALSFFDMARSAGGPVDVDVSLVQDVGGLPGSTALDTFAVTATKSLQQGGSILSAVSSSMPTLTGGLQYWFVASVSGDRQGAGWMVSTTDLRPLPAAIRRVDGDWSRSWPNGAFRVFADQLSGPGPAPIPEPATLLLIGTGLLAIARRCKSSITQTPL